MTLDPNDLLLFARVADAGSFSRAAERAGLPKSTVSRRVAALVGPTTAAVLVGHLGPLGAYHSPKALEKAMGLNLKEASSGRDRFKQQRIGWPIHLRDQFDTPPDFPCVLIGTRQHTLHPLM